VTLCNAKSAFPLVPPARGWLNVAMTPEQDNTANPRPAPDQPPGTGHFNVLLHAVGQKKDREAFIALFQHFAPRLKSFLMKKGSSPEHAEELAQETMLSVWNKAAQYDPARASASTWIFTIARNRHIDSMRRGTRPDIDINDPAFIIADTAPTPDENSITKDRSQKIAAALLTLPPEQSDVIRKSFFEDKTHAEIAAETKIPLGTIKSRLRLAMDRLQKHLEGHQGQELL